MNARRREVTFIVRMWLPEGLPGDTQWRGSVQEIASGKRLFVTGTRDISDFIATHLDESPAVQE